MVRGPHVRLRQQQQLLLNQQKQKQPQLHAAQALRRGRQFKKHSGSRRVEAQGRRNRPAAATAPKQQEASDSDMEQSALSNDEHSDHEAKGDKGGVDGEQQADDDDEGNGNDDKVVESQEDDARLRLARCREEALERRRAAARALQPDGPADVAVLTPHLLLGLFSQCTALPQLRAEVARSNKFPLEAGDWEIHPTAEHDLNRRIQQLHVRPSSASGKQPFDIWMYADDLEVKSMQYWLAERQFHYHVIGVKKVEGDDVTLEIQAAIHSDVVGESTDTLANYVTEWGGENCTLSQDVLPLIEQWRRTRPNRTLPLMGTLGASKSARARRGAMKEQLAVFITLLPEEDATPLQQRFKSLLSADKCVQQMVHCTGGFTAKTPPARDDPRVPASFPLTPTNSRSSGSGSNTNSHKRLSVMLLHSDKDGWVQLRGWQPSSSSSRGHFSLVEALELQLVGVRWCVMVVLTCGGWPSDDARQQQLKQLLTKHRCWLLTSARPNVPYQDPADATADTFLRFGAHLALRGLLELPRPEQLPHEGLKQNIESSAELERQIEGMVREGSERVLLDSAHSTLPVLVSPEGTVVHLRKTVTLDPVIGGATTSSSSSSFLSPSGSSSSRQLSAADQDVDMTASVARAASGKSELFVKLPRAVASQVGPLRQERWTVVPGSVHISSVLQWMVVYDAAAEAHAPNMTDVSPSVSTSQRASHESAALSDTWTTSANTRPQYVLVLRGHALNVDSFKNVQQKIVHAHKVGNPGAASRLLDVIAVRQMAQLARAHSMQEVWLPLSGRVAGRLLPVLPPQEQQQQQVAARPRPSLFAWLEQYEYELLSQPGHQ